MTGADGRDPTNQVDPRTVTGAWHFAQGRYGRRATDKPWWWVAVYHLLAKPLSAAFAILMYIALASLAKKCGVHLPGGAP